MNASQDGLIAYRALLDIKQHPGDVALAQSA